MASNRKSSRFRFWRSPASSSEKPLAASSPAPPSSPPVVSAPVPEEPPKEPSEETYTLPEEFIVETDSLLSSPPIINSPSSPPESSTPSSPPESSTPPTPSTKSAHQNIIPECCKADAEAQDVSSPWDEHVDDYVSAVIAIPHLSAMQRFEMLNRVNELLVPLKSE